MSARVSRTSETIARMKRCLAVGLISTQDGRKGCDDSLRLQAEGFWNDAGVSSHTVCSVSSTQAGVTHRPVDRMAHRTVRFARAFTRGSFPRNPQTLLGCQCAREQVYHSTNVQKMQERIPSAGGAPDIPMSEARGFTARSGNVLSLYDRTLKQQQRETDNHGYTRVQRTTSEKR